VRENRTHGSMRRREETRPVGKPARPRRLPPTLPRPDYAEDFCIEPTASGERASIEARFWRFARLASLAGRDLRSSWRGYTSTAALAWLPLSGRGRVEQEPGRRRGCSFRGQAPPFLHGGRRTFGFSGVSGGLPVAMAKRHRSRDSRARACRTARSASCCSSASTPPHTTCVRCSPNSASPRALN
jgi:hypothetical protein